MDNKGFLELTLVDVTGAPVKDQNTTVTFFRNGDPSNPFEPKTGLAFPPAKRFKLPAFPQVNTLNGRVTPERYKETNTGFFTLTDGQILPQALTLFRNPKKWDAEFRPWSLLAEPHSRLKEVLEASPGLRIKGGENFPLFTADAYNEISNDTSVLAKATLLNLYTAMSELREPTGSDQPWFGFVRRIFQIDRERLIAQVDAKMDTLVRQIHSNIGDFNGFIRTPASNHEGNVTTGVPAGFQVETDKMVSVKTVLSQGNIQLTIAPGKDANNNPVTVLDMDFDENHDLLKHVGDVFKHLFTGGTHPYDVHDILLLFNKNFDLGYQLV